MASAVTAPLSIAPWKLAWVILIAATPDVWVGLAELLGEYGARCLHRDGVGNLDGAEVLQCSCTESKHLGDLVVGRRHVGGSHRRLQHRCADQVNRSTSGGKRLYLRFKIVHTAIQPGDQQNRCALRGWQVTPCFKRELPVVTG